MGVAHRPCKKLRCPFCGPWLLALKAAGMAMMPTLTPDGQITGAPMMRRILYRLTVPTARMTSWASSFRRRRKKLGVADHHYIGFDIATETVVLSTLDLPRRGQKSTELKAPADILDVVVDLTLKTVTAERHDGVVMLDGSTFYLWAWGKIRTTDGIVANPDTITRLAPGAAWVLEEAMAIKPKEAAQVFDDERVRHHKAQGDEGFVPWVETAPMMNPKDRLRVLDRLRQGDPVALAVKKVGP